MLSYSHQNITQDDIEVVVKALKEDFLTCGVKVEEFEKALVKYVGVKAACVLDSVTSTLYLTYLALNVKDKIVLTTPLTFIATSNTALMAGAKVEFIDIGTDGNIDVKKLRARLEKGSQNITAVAVVDFTGQSVETGEVSALCEKFKLPLPDDASHALGTEFCGKKVGSSASLSVFSFRPVKPITTFEGGAIVSDNEGLIERIKKLRNHTVVKKRLWDSDSFELGFNYRLSDVACVLRINQFAKLDINSEKRKKIASFYDKEFEKNPYFSTLKIPPHKRSSRHFHPILLYPEFRCQKEEIFKALLKREIGVQVHYEPTYGFSFYKKELENLRPENADNFYKAELSIPCYQEMSLEQAKFVKEGLFEMLENGGYCG